MINKYFSINMTNYFNDLSKQWSNRYNKLNNYALNFKYKITKKGL